MAVGHIEVQPSYAQGKEHRIRGQKELLDLLPGLAKRVEGRFQTLFTEIFPDLAVCRGAIEVPQGEANIRIGLRHKILRARFAVLIHIFG